MDGGGKTELWREALNEADRQILVCALEQGIKAAKQSAELAGWVPLYEATLQKLLPSFRPAVAVSNQAKA
jgi:hypothetical protein